MAGGSGGHGRARVFFALWPGAALARRMAGHGARLEAAIGGRAGRIRTLHLTLAFLGDVDASHLSRLVAPPAAVSAPCFTLRLDRCGAWPRSGIGWLAPSVIPPALALLQERLSLWVESLGFAQDARGFHPHVTVVRKARAGLAEAAVEPLDWPVAEWVLARSHLSPQGAGYEPLARFALQRAAPDGR